MKILRLGLLVKTAIFVLALAMVVVAYAQEKKQALFLTVTDPVAADKILDILKKDSESKYLFTGNRKDAKGKLTKFSEGSLSLAEVRQVARASNATVPTGSKASWVHSTLTDFVAISNLNKIKEVLQGVDKKLYKLDVVQAK